MGKFENFIRSIVQKHPELIVKLKKAASKQTPFQYVYQTVTMTGLSSFAFYFIAIMTTKKYPLVALGAFGFVTFLIPIIYKFFLGYVDVLITKKGRELNGDLLFISEYFLVSLESGLPLGNAIQEFSKLDRPGAIFFKKIYTEFRTGKDLEAALMEGSKNCPSDELKILLKRLKDSLSIGVDLKMVLINFIEESAQKKVVEIQGYSKKLNPLVMVYLLLGIVCPSLGVTFFMLGATFIGLTPEGLKFILIVIFLIMLAFQYVAYSGFKFSKTAL
jgi:archaellum biogenesis protein FlaJ (TadC family)